MDQENEDPSKLVYARSDGNTLINFGRDVKRERAKLDIHKTNYREFTIDWDKKVEETFTYDGWMVQ